jgi:hypothetical protein
MTDKKENESGVQSTAFRTFSLIAVFWSATILFLGVGANSWEKDKTFQLTLKQARSLFHMILDMRYWNAAHGGVYVPITRETQPNPYLDIPDRDITTLDGQRLTMINPAYMTRQLSEIASKRNKVKFHITSQKPIRPANAPYPWEEKALQKFSRAGDEYYEWNLPKRGAREFRYMAPLWTEEACLKCHAKQGYKLGELRGGISVTIPVGTILSIRDHAIWKLDLIFLGIWLLGIIGIYGSYRSSVKTLTELQAAFGEINMLRGIIPICSSCKKIRTDSGAWEQIEVYIRDRSDAEFSHGICPDCVKTLYPEYSKEESNDD